MESIFRNSAYNNFQVIGYVLILYVMLIVIRFVWLCLLSQGKYSRRDNRDKVSYLSIVLLSVSGVRGALTLAGAFAVASVISYYEQRIADLKMNRASQDNNARNRELEIILHRHAVAVQLAYIQQLLMEGKVSRGRCTQIACDFAQSGAYIDEPVSYADDDARKRAEQIIMHFSLSGKAAGSV